MDIENKIRSLALGAVVGGATPENKGVNQAIADFDGRIEGVCCGKLSLLNLNVVFHVPGNMLKPEHVGIRTGRFLKKWSALMMQVAVPEPLPEAPEKLSWTQLRPDRRGC